VNLNHLGIGVATAAVGYGLYKVVNVVSEMQAQLQDTQLKLRNEMVQTDRKLQDAHRAANMPLHVQTQGFREPDFGSPAPRGRANSISRHESSSDIARMMEVNRIYKSLATPGYVVTFGHLNRENLARCAGINLEDDEITAAKEIMGITGDVNEEVKFNKFFDWWTMWSDLALARNKRGHSDEYTRRFKFQHTLSQPQKEAFKPTDVTRQPHGQTGGLDWRMTFHLQTTDPITQNLKRTQISPWHDIPLRAGTCPKKGSQLYHAVIEIPKWTRDKFEIATGETYNPIKQDVKDGALRKLEFYQMFNYGALPQTWEDPNPEKNNADTGYRGDNDPIDCVEIGARKAEVGAVLVVKVLGVLAMIDDDETDWKLIVIDKDDELADRLDDVRDLHQLLPGLVEGIVDWFTHYKTALGKKPPNKFAMKGEAKNREYAETIIMETHQYWQELLGGKASQEDISQVIVPSTHGDDGRPIQDA